MTDQEVFDMVCQHLLTQNKRSTRGINSTTCAYRGADGTRCAVGCLIPDTKYRTFLEGSDVRDLEDLMIEILGEGVSIDLLEDLQLVHDCFLPFDWPEELVRVGKAHGLAPRAGAFL